MKARDRRSVWVMDSFLLTSILNKSTRNTRSLSKVNFMIMITVIPFEMVAL